MKKNSKRNAALLISGTVVLAGLIGFDALYKPTEELHRPQLREDDGDHDISTMGKKLVDWTAEQAAAYENLLQAKLQTRGARAAIDAKGRWINRGPFNMPGAWNMATMDVGTDTIYAVTCGHYGTVQTIWKGTVRNAANTAGGNDFTMLPGSGRFPTRIRDIDVFHKNNTKVICYTVENGAFYFSHDDGLSFTKATGLPTTLQASAVDRKTGTIYATDGIDMYTSVDLGVSFTKLLNLGAKAPTRLRTPLYSTQQGYGTIFVQHGADFKMITGSTARTMGSLPSTVGIIDDNFNVEGDIRRFYVSSKNSKGTGTTSQFWFTSVDTGKTWEQKLPTAHYYDGVCELSAFEGFGVGIIDPKCVTAGYAHPSVSNDALSTTYENDKQWGWYQVGWSTMEQQQDRLRKYYHPDFQSTAFFLDKEGKEFSLWMSDGGLFVNRSVYLNPANMLDAEKYGFQNIMLQGGTAVTEVYEFGMVSGSKGATDFALGTQDQGVQTTQPTLAGEMVQVIQSPGGDGDPAASGPDGLYGWQISGNGVKRPFALYSGTTFRGSKDMNGTKLDITVTNIWHDLKDYSTTLWVLNGELNKVVWNGSSFATTTKTFGNTGNVAAMCQSPANTSLFWVLDNNKVYKSTNGGGTFGAAVTVPMNASSNQRDVRGWAFDDNTILFAGKSNNAVTSILSTDGGATWTTVSGLVNVDVKWMQGDKNKTIAMASTKVGPYLFDLATKTWVDAAGDINTGAPYFDGKWGAYNPTTNTFRFSTWGFGVWDFEVNDGSPKIAASSTIPATVKYGESIKVNWTTNQTGSVTIDLIKDGAKVITLGTVPASDKTFTWIVDSDAPYGSGYEIKLTAGTATASTSTFAVMPVLMLIPQSSLAIESFNSQGNSTTEAAKNVLDGNPTTIWHTSYASGAPAFPHEIVFNVSGLTGKDTMQAFSYTPRSDGENGRINEFDLFVSADKASWTKVATGTFVNSGAEERVLFSQGVAGTAATYVKFVAKSEINSQSFASMAEFNLYKKETSVGTNPVRTKMTTDSPLSLVNGTVHLHLLKPDNVRVQVFSVNGRIVAQSTLSLSTGNHAIPLNLREIGAGNYLVKINTSSAGVLHKKMVVQ